LLQRRRLKKSDCKVQKIGWIQTHLSYALCAAIIVDMYLAGSECFALLNAGNPLKNSRNLEGLARLHAEQEQEAFIPNHSLLSMFLTGMVGSAKSAVYQPRRAGEEQLTQTHQS